MARVRWHGAEFTAAPVRQLPNGNWLMVAQTHGARFAVGSQIEIRPDEVLEMTGPEMPPDGEPEGYPSEEGDKIAAEAQSLAELELAMAEERKTLTPVGELLAKVLAPKSVE